MFISKIVNLHIGDRKQNDSARQRSHRARNVLVRGERRSANRKRWLGSEESRSVKDSGESPPQISHVCLTGRYLLTLHAHGLMPLHGALTGVNTFSIDTGALSRGWQPLQCVYGY